jgi:TPR repeat protein
LLHEGSGIKRDYQEAIKWFKKAADQGIANAQHNLGVIYSGGLGVTKNQTEADKWFHLAEKQGNALIPIDNNIFKIIKIYKNNLVQPDTETVIANEAKPIK